MRSTSAAPAATRSRRSTSPHACRACAATRSPGTCSATGGLGYDQIMRAENTNSSSTTRLHAAVGGSGTCRWTWSFPRACNFAPPTRRRVHPPAGAGPRSIRGRSGQIRRNRAATGCFANYWKTFDLATIYLAHNGSNLFMSGTTGNARSAVTATTRTRTWCTCCRAVRVVREVQSCADAVISLPTLVDPAVPAGGSGEARAISVTSLAAGYVGQTPYLAVGLTDGGVQIYDVSNPVVAAAHRHLHAGWRRRRFADAADGAGVGSVGVRAAGRRRHQLGQPRLRRARQRRRKSSGELGDVVRAGHDVVDDGRAVGGVRAARRWHARWWRSG